MYSNPFPSPKREAQRIPPGQITGTIPLDACKAYPTRYYIERNLPVTIAYADAYTKHETNNLNIKYIPNGSIRTPHPQIVFFVSGQYHLESLIYPNSNAANWTTWMEFHLDHRYTGQLIAALNQTRNLGE